MTVSIIIRAKNEAESLRRVLERIASQKVDFRVEVIVVDSGSTDATVSVARDLGCVVVEIRQEEFSWGGALNTGIGASKGRYLVNLSAHCDPVDDVWLPSLIRRLSDPAVAGVYGRQVPRRGYDPLEEVELEMWFPADAERLKTTGFSNASSAIRRDVWEKHPFDEEILSCEDGEWASRVRDAGYRIEYEPDSVVYHSHPIEMRNVYLRWYWRSYVWKELSGSTREGNPLYAVHQTIKFMAKDTALMMKRNYRRYLPAIPIYESVRQYARWRGARDVCRRTADNQGFGWFEPRIPAFVRAAARVLDARPKRNRGTSAGERKGRRNPSFVRLRRRLWSRVYQRQVRVYFPADVIARAMRNAEPLAPGYAVRPFRPEDDLEAWARLLNEDGNLGHWTADRLRNEIIPFLVAPDAATMLFCGDELVGCANTADFPGCKGRIGLGMYMYLAKAHRGRRGLGYILSFYTLNFFVREGYEGAMATTDPSRLAALAIYMSNGCEPRRDSLFSYVQWWRIHRRLGPLIEKMKQRAARHKASSRETA